jgi:hypothetical protein
MNRFISLSDAADLSVVEVDLPPEPFNTIIFYAQPQFQDNLYVWLDDPRISTGINPNAPVFALQFRVTGFWFSTPYVSLTIPNVQRDKIYVMRNGLAPSMTVQICKT